MANSTLSFELPQGNFIISRLHHDIGDNSKPLTFLRHVVYAMLGFIGIVGRAVSGNADENVRIRKAVGGRNWLYPDASGTRGRRLKRPAPTAHFQL